MTDDIDEDYVHEAPPPRRNYLPLFAAALIIAVALALGAAVWAANVNSNRIDNISQLQKQVNAEGAERRSDTCRAFEQQHKQEVTQLARTYGYLVRLPKAERGLTINKTVAAGVPLLERNARSDQDDFGIFVPKYCDEPDVGLPEPDPVVPKRPKSLDPPAVPAAIP